MLGLPTESSCEYSEPDTDERCDLLHVFPTWGRSHKLSVDCWCRPSVDWDSGGPVVVHEVHH